MKSYVLCCVLVLMSALCLHAENRQIVLKDGSMVEAVSVVLVHGQVQLKLENGRFIAFDASDVDLAASGLEAVKQPKPKEEKTLGSSAGGDNGRFGSAIAAPGNSEGGLEITDQDVKHVHPEEKQPDDSDTEDEATGNETVSLEVGNLNRVIKDGILTVTGSVNNTGSEKVSAVSITAVAENAKGEAIAQGTTGISSEIKGGQSSPFAIAMAVPGEVANVTIRARAVHMSFEAPKEKTPPKAEGQKDKTE